MSQSEHYKTLLSLMKDFRVEDASMDDADVYSTSVILDRSKVAEESLDEARRHDDEELESQEEDVHCHCPPSNTLAKLNEEMSQLNVAASGSGKNQDVGEASNDGSLDTQQNRFDLLLEYDCTNLIELTPGSLHEGHSLYKSVLNDIYEGHYETAKNTCEVNLEGLIKETRTKDNILLISHYLECLALIYRKANKYDDAIILLSNVSKVHKIIFGHNHLVVAITLNNLGICLGKVGNYVEALSFCRSALNILCGNVETCSRQTFAKQCYCIGALHQMQDQYEFAAEYYVEALDHYQPSSKTAVPDIKTIILNLITCYQKLGNVKQAETLQKWC